MKKVYLTFDDGPNPLITSKILDILKEEKAKATFFVCGKQAKEHPELLKRIHDEGHAIGNHSYDHKFSAVFGAPSQIKKTNNVIKEITGANTKYYRAPFGAINLWLLFYLWIKGMKHVRWSASGRDWERIGREKIVNNVLSKVKDGSVVLLHDGALVSSNKDREPTVKAVKEIIKELKKKDYEFLPL